MDATEEQRVFLLLLDEIEETLVDFEKRCLSLENAVNPADLKVIFRAAHNIKGGSRLFGLAELGSFVHCVEELLSALLTLRRRVDPPCIDLLLKSHSLLTEWIRLLRRDRKALMDTSELRARIEERIRNLRESEAPDQAASQLPPAPPPTQASVSPSAPPSAPPPAPPPAATPEGKGPAVSAASTAAPEPLFTLDPIHVETVEVPSESPKVVQEPRRLSWKTFQSQKRRRTGNLKVSLPKIDEVMQLLGELSIHQSILWHGKLTGTLSSPVCQNAVALNQKVLKDLQSLVLALRMQPVESLFQRLERAARDIARELGKPIQVVLSGSEVQLDKTLSEIMIDPMIHLIRNAVDHGIESERRRREQGKAVLGKIEIGASQDSGVVILTVADDGCGIDPRLVFRKAIEKGLVSGGQSLSDAEIIQLIFASGFSTRDKVTEISGRGVGMDVVQQAIQQIGGKIVTVSRPGQGTCFQISLPTSLEVIDGLVIRVDGASYVVPMQDVAEIVNLSSFRLERIGGSGWAINLHDAVVPVESLGDYFPLGNPVHPPRSVEPLHRRPALVIRLPGLRGLALAVDEVVTQQQIVVRPLSDKLSAVPGFTGATVLGNGEPGLILSMSFIGECFMNWVARARRAA